MALNITQNGIAERHKDGSVTLVRPDRNGGALTEIEVPEPLADEFALATGDIIAGRMESLTLDAITAEQENEDDDPDGWDTQYDEPRMTARSAASRSWLTPRLPAERLTDITHINGQPAGEERPTPRTRRSHSERTPPDRLLPCTLGPDDRTGQTLDLFPLGAGCMGIIRGAHGTGLTRTLRAVLDGITLHAPDCTVFVLLLRARSEEITDWRRRFPQADVVVCPSALNTNAALETLRLCDLMLEAAQRQTEQGRDVILLLDSLTGLWGAMLEAEHADAQQEADQSASRQRIREWVQKAGCFHGAAPLGGGLGGSLTIVGTVWYQATDAEAEEERDTHPHLRLPEYLLPEATWQISLSETMALERDFPAINLRQSLSRYEENLLSAEAMEQLRARRNTFQSG